MTNYLESEETRAKQVAIDSKKAGEEYIENVLSNILKESRNYSHLFKGKGSEIMLYSHSISHDEEEEVSIKYDENGNPIYHGHNIYTPKKRNCSPEHLVEHLFQKYIRKDDALKSARGIARNLSKSFISESRE